MERNRTERSTVPLEQTILDRSDNPEFGPGFGTVYGIDRDSPVTREMTKRSERLR